MKRIVSTGLIVLAAVLSAPIVSSGPIGSAWAQMDKMQTDKMSMDRDMEMQMAKIKKMVGDIEMRMKSKGMAMDAMGKEKTMKMLMDVTRMLEDVQKMTQTP